MTDPNKNRSLIIRVIYIVVVVVLIGRLASVQVFDKSYKREADAQALREITQYPARGYIYDRNGQLMVYNEAVFDLMVIPSMTVEKVLVDVIDRKRYPRMDEMVPTIDTALLCKRLGISNDEYVKRMEKAFTYSSVAASVFMSQISKEELATFQSELHKFRGFYITRRTLRRYARPIGAHVLGYVGEVMKKDIEKDPYYQAEDYIGRSGLEQTYEEELRGKKGKRIMHVDVHSREIGHYLNGAKDITPQEGNNLYTSLDADLQEYAEKLMQNKRGCIVAIEPATGEILALCSAPSYDPNLLVGRRAASSNYPLLEKDPERPLYNRALQGQYPPGSIFKVAQAMTALQLGVIQPGTGFACDKSLVGCHNHPSATCVSDAIKMSCNPYFYNVYNRVIQQGKHKGAFQDSEYGLTVWRDYMLRFGFGRRLEVDLPNVSKGNIPDTAYYNRWYGSLRWKFSTIYSNSIGQGEVTVVPIQMANLACVMANRGYYITPHVVRFIGNDSVKTRPEETVKKHDLGIEKKYFELGVKGMYGVVHEPGGTGHKADVPGLDVCGKTGTAQNGTPSQHRADHSVFISFAPRDNPKIAVAVYVENAPGGGGSWAAPIAGLVIEKYLKGTVERTQWEQTYMQAMPCQKVAVPKPKTNNN